MSPYPGRSLKPGIWLAGIRTSNQSESMLENPCSHYCPITKHTVRALWCFVFIRYGSLLPIYFKVILLALGNHSTIASVVSNGASLKDIKREYLMRNRWQLLTQLGQNKRLLLRDILINNGYFMGYTPVFTTSQYLDRYVYMCTL